MNQEYALTFALSGNPDGFPGTKKLGVGLTLGGASPYAFSYSIGSNTHTDMEYQYVTAYFTASDTSEVLQFQDQSSYEGSTPYGAVIGNVALTAVPEPTTMLAGALMLLPLGVSAIRIMRKSRVA